MHVQRLSKMRQLKYGNEHHLSVVDASRLSTMQECAQSAKELYNINIFIIECFFADGVTLLSK
jgi:hypothetical protein